MNYLKCGIGQKKGIRIGKTYVFCCQNAEPACDEKRVFSSIQHTGKIIHGSIRIRSAHTLDECRDHIIVHLAALVVYGRVLLKAGSHPLIIYHHSLSTHKRANHNFQYIKEFTRITCTISEECVCLLYSDLHVLEHLIVRQGPVQQLLQILFLKRLQHKDLTA